MGYEKVIITTNADLENYIESNPGLPRDTSIDYNQDCFRNKQLLIINLDISSYSSYQIESFEIIDNHVELNIKKGDLSNPLNSIVSLWIIVENTNKLNSFNYLIE